MKKNGVSELRRFVELLGVRIIEAHPSPASLDWMLVESIGESQRKLLLLEMTFRAGGRVVVEPTADEIAACRVDPWRVWNTKRAVSPGELP